MKIGELKHRVILRKIVNIVDESGFTKETSVDYKKVWASIRNLYGKEYFEAASIQREKTVKFIIRWVDDLDETMTISYRGKSYNITSIDNIKYENKYIEIKALEVDGSG